MKIADIEVVEFRTTTHQHVAKWGYGVWTEEERPAISAITKISTDDGVAGYTMGGNKAVTEQVIKPLLVGENPLDREKLWHWMDQMVTFGQRLSERDLGIVDCALWDLMGNLTGLPV